MPSDEDSRVLLALSDLLVLTALERAASRTMPRSRRSMLRPSERHRAYIETPIQPTRPGQTYDQVIDKALTDAWVLCPMLVARNHLPVDPNAWAQLLDTYTRALLQMSQQHTAQRLAPHLGPLVVNWDDKVVDVDFELPPAARAS